MKVGPAVCLDVGHLRVDGWVWPVAVLRRLIVMGDDEETLEAQSPVQWAVVIASLAGFVSLVLLYWLARPAAELLKLRWAEILVYAVIPILITFLILYRSSWHREITGVARTSYLFLVSCSILGGEVIAAGILVLVLMLCLMGITGGNH